MTPQDQINHDAIEQRAEVIARTEWEARSLPRWELLSKAPMMRDLLTDIARQGILAGMGRG